MPESNLKGYADTGETDSWQMNRKPTGDQNHLRSSLTFERHVLFCASPRTANLELVLSLKTAVDNGAGKSSHVYLL